MATKNKDILDLQGLQTYDGKIKGLISNKADNTTSFTEASTRENIASGETIPTILGKIKKWFTDLKTVAFTGSYNDLSNKPNMVSSVDFSDLNANGEKIGTFNANISGAGLISQDINIPSLVEGTGIDIVVDANNNTKTISVDNKYAVSTVASQGLSSTEQANARANIGAGTSSFSGSYNDLSNKPSLATVATSGSYNDLSNKPTIPTGTVTSVSTGTGLTGGPITNSGTISISNHSADYIAGGYLNINPGRTPSPLIVPYIYNDIAYLLKRGGSAVVRYDGVEQTISTDNLFDGSPSSWSISPTSTGVTTLEIELTLPAEFRWTSTIYCDHSETALRAKNVKVEVKNTNYENDVWTQKYANTDQSSQYFYFTFTHTPVGADNAGSGFNKIRFTFSSFNNSNTFRIAELGVINYASSGMKETFLSRGGGTVYGSVYPASNNGAELGASNNYWHKLFVTQINGVVVGSSPKFTDTNNRKSFYGTCDTASATAAKVVTLSDTTGWELKAGTIVGVKFTNSNTASDVTLNVNGTGAKSIYYNTAVYTGSSIDVVGRANNTNYYMYDGSTYWVWLGTGRIINSQVQQIPDDSTNSNFEVLFSKTADNTDRNETAKKSSKLTFNPSTSELKLNSKYVPASSTIKEIQLVSSLPSDASSHPEILYLVGGS